MDSTPKRTIDPSRIVGIEELLEKLLEGAEFTRFPADLIGAALQRGVAILDVLNYADPPEACHLTDAAAGHVNAALALVLAWSRQEREQAREACE